jgi:hypothetical protein
VVGASGAAQLARDWLDRLKASKARAVDAFRKEWQPKLEAAYTELEAACKGRGDAYTALATARVAEEAASDDHELLVEKIMGEVRTIFPKDRKRWDVVFPRVGRGGRVVEEPEPTPGPGGAPPTP